MEGVREAAKVVVKRAAQVADIVGFTVFHLACDVKEFAESGFGVPKLITTAASLSVVACAIGGHTSLALDFMNKIYGKKSVFSIEFKPNGLIRCFDSGRECIACNGWEGLRCTSCRGTGKVQYLIVNTGLEGGETANAQSAAKAMVDGRAQLQEAPSSADTGFTLPTKECATCAGTGVMKCTECNGDAWKRGFHADTLTNSPIKAINAFKKLNVPNERVLESMEDPDTAEFLLFTRPELENGYRIDDDVKKEIWWHYEEWRRKRLARDAVANQEPGWETVQPVLVATDPTGTLEDPVIVKNVSYYKARKLVEADVQNMVMPPRPADWGGPVNYPLKESDWSEEDLKDPKKREERDVLLDAQAKIMNGILDASWGNHWRESKIEELTKQKIENYVKTLGAKERKTEAKPAPKAQPTTPVKPAEKPKAKAPALSKEEKKKQERKERAEKMAKQAAEREAALKKGKAK